MSISCDPFVSMSPAEAKRFMQGNRHPIREEVAERVMRRPVLDLGCGRGIRIKELYGRSRYTGIDCSPALIARARVHNPGYRFFVSDIVDFLAPLEANSVPVAIMVSVLEHVPSLEKAQEIFKQASRVARELLIGWHTPPNYAHTDIIQVKAELNNPIWQNHYKRGSFGQPTYICKVLSAELWTVRD